MRALPLGLILALGSAAFAAPVPTLAPAPEVPAARSCRDLGSRFVNTWIKRNFQGRASAERNPQIRRLLKDFQKLRADARRTADGDGCGREKLARLESRFQGLRTRAHKEWRRRFEHKLNSLLGGVGRAVVVPRGAGVRVVPVAPSPRREWPRPPAAAPRRARADDALVWFKGYLVSLGREVRLGAALSRKVANAIIAESRRYLSGAMTPFRKACLIAAQAFQESLFHPRAYNRGSGAAGVLQLMPGTARDMGLRVDRHHDERFDLYRNLSAGARYLQRQLDRFAAYSKNLRISLALAAYNAGPGNVRGGRIPPIRETRNYVREIMSRFAYFQKLWRRSPKS